MSGEMTVILANGTFPHTPETLSCLDGAARIVCCDGAAEALLQSGRLPTVIIGDLDSLTQERRRQFADRLVEISEQESNDLSKAFQYCLKRGWRHLVILGATGKREDHTLGNLSLLVDYAAEVPDIRLVTDEGTFFVALASGAFPARRGQQISIFAMEPDTAIHSGGLKYPLRWLAPKRWWQASLNEALADSFTLEFPSGRPLLIFQSNSI